MLRTSRYKSVATFRVPLYVTGVAGFIDAGDPNAFPPVAGRILSASSSLDRLQTAFTGGGGLNPLGTGMSVGVALCNGTSAGIRFWVKDETTGLWFALAGSLNLNYASNSTNFFQGVVVPGAKFFIQISANTGVTRFAQFIR